MKKKFETSKLILWFGEIFFDILIIVLFYGWLHSVGDISQPFTSILITKGVLYAGYLLKAGIENVSKGNLAISKISNLKLNDFITVLSGLLSGANGYNTADVLNNILQSIQTVISNHAMDNTGSNDFISTINNDQQNDMQSTSTNMGENIGTETNGKQNDNIESKVNQ